MTRRTTRKERIRRRRVYLGLCSVLTLALVLLVLLESRDPSAVSADRAAAPGVEGPAAPPEPVAAGNDVREKVPERPAGKPVATGPVVRVAIIIDDVGYDDRLDQRAAAIPFPLTFSVLPGLERSAISAARLSEAGCEIMLHLPMEPESYPEKNPGPGALFTFMSPDEIRTTLRRDILSVPGARGVNNHMGSLFTVREDLLGVVFEELRNHGFFFVDSRTTTATAAQRVARRFGVKTGSRSVFLDNSDDPLAIAAQLEQLFRVARRERSAIGIGHYRESTLQVLAQQVPQLCRRLPDVRMVHASEVVH